MEELKKERGEDVLENLDNLEKRKKIRKILITGVIVVFVMIVLFIGFSIYSYFRSPEKTLGLGANIESVLLSSDGTISYIKLAGGSLDKNITKIKFIFNDNENEYNYETSEGIQDIEVPFKRSFWDWLFGRQLVGKYDYEINSDEAGLNDFNNINEVGVLFEYQTGTGNVIETPVLDTGKPTNRTTTTSGGGGGGGDGGGPGPTPTCTDECSLEEIYCINDTSYTCTSGSDGCLDLTEIRCNENQTCVNGTGCVELIECTDNENCSYMSHECSYGICNLTTSNCEIKYNTTKICRESSGECDVAEFCSGSSSNCSSNIFNASGTLCSLGFCDGSGSCVECIDDSDCESEESCVSGACLIGECLDDADCISRGPGFICNTTNSQCEWKPPIGIPRPEFGIEETYRMYDDPANRNPVLTYTQNAEGGYFTHYIDVNDPNATDKGNTYGTVVKPRKTIPRTVVFGSVVEIHGGPYCLVADPKWNGEGTSASPIFYRGYDVNDKPRIDHISSVGYNDHVDAEYIIFENMNFHSLNILAYSETHHITVRNCDVEGLVTDAQYLSGINIDIPTAGLSGASIHHIVIYNSVIYNHGNWQASGDPDNQGIAISDRINNVWIVDNLFYHNSGNGVQTNTGILSNYETTHHIYMGRNQGYENKQDMLWTKTGTDIIFSQNVVWDHSRSDSSLGGGMGLQYGPVRVWFLFNEIYHCNYGIRMSTDDGPGGLGPGTDTYVIGNVIYDIHKTGEEPGGTAIYIASEYSERGIFCNTIYNTDGGVLNVRRAILNINNNIFAEVDGNHVDFVYPDSLPTSDIQYDVFDIPARIQWGTSTTYNLTTFNAAFPGKATGSMEADPLFVDADSNDFHLQSASPAIGAGMQSGAVQDAFDRFEELYGIDIRKDIEGAVRPQGAEWDIGAYEYGAGSTTPQPEPEPEPEPEPDTKPQIEFEALIPDVTALFVMNNIIKSGGNQSAVIRCDLKEPAYLAVTIYDAKGKKITAVYDEYKEAGTYQFVWTGKDSAGATVGSGIYIVHMKCGNYSETKKIAVVK